MSDRKKLPDVRTGVVHRFVLGGRRFYLRTGNYDGGDLGELFLEGGDHVASDQDDPTGDIVIDGKEMSVSAWADAFAASVSIGLQHGVPLKVYVDKFLYTQFEPRGETDNVEIPRASSVLDYVFRFLRRKHPEPKSGIG